MEIGDLVALKDKFPIWILSNGLGKDDYGIIVDIDDNKKKLKFIGLAFTRAM